MMKPFWHIGGLLILLVAYDWPANASNDDEWGALNDNMGHMVRTNVQPDYSRDAIYIDERPYNVYDGSGDDLLMDDEDGLDYSGDDEEIEGSGDSSPCLRLEKQMREKGLLGLYIPQCTGTGEFERIQCRSSTGVCWCVDMSGREIKGTKTRSPNQPDCNNIVIDPPIPPPKPANPVNTKAETRDFDVNPIDLDRDINFPTSTELDNHINIIPDNGVEIDTAEPPPNSVEMLPSKGDNHVHSSMVMSQPGILAGIIGGALVGLLCAVLLVMFIVYRMRKKDEGSYALDERKHSPSMHQYARAPTKEFYA